jgi:uncharacterized protein
MSLKKLLVKLFKQILWLGILCLFLILSTPVSYALQIQDIPNPRQQYGGWVTDMANILSPEAEAQLNKAISNLESKNGTEMAVVTVLETQPAISPKAFATELFNTWGIGKKSKNNGVLFLVSTGDRRVEIERGSGFRTSLSDRKIQQIIDIDIIPRFQQGYLEAGILKGTENAIAILSNTHQKQILDFPGYIWIIGNLSLLGFIGFSARLLLFNRRRQILGSRLPNTRERFSAIELELSQPPSKPSKKISLYQRLVAISLIGLIFILFYSLGWEMAKEYQAEKLNSLILIGEATWILILYFLPYITTRITSLAIATVTAIVLFPFPSTCLAIALASILNAISLNISNGKKERMTESLRFTLGMTVLVMTMFVFGKIDTSRENILTALTVTSLLFALQNAPVAWEIIPILQQCCGYTKDTRETIPSPELPKNAILIIPQGRSQGAAEQKHYPVHCTMCRNPMTAIRGEKLKPFLILNDLVGSQHNKIERIGWHCISCYPELNEKTIHIRTYISSVVSKKKSSSSTVESDNSITSSETSWSSESGGNYNSSESSSSWSSDSGGSYSSGSDFGGGMSDGGSGGGSW